VQQISVLKLILKLHRFNKNGVSGSLPSYKKETTTEEKPTFQWNVAVGDEKLIRLQRHY